MLHPLKKLLLVAGLCALPLTAAKAFVDVSITFAPPVLPVYEQPLCPADGYLWTPGYWAYGDYGYYWVPGAWVLPPRIGYLWTPGYWGFNDGLYVFHTGYWGPSVGFYGGVNYGFGYGGFGYSGGEWRGSRFAYNTAITRVNTTVINNTYYNRTVVNRNVTDSRASFNGRGGVNVQPTAAQRQIAAAPHLRPTEAQVSRRERASQDRGNLASVNRGRPANLVTRAQPEHGVRERYDNQMGRIANGVSDRQLNGNQARNLENREVALQRQTNAERRAYGGNGLTPAERQLAERRENRLSRDIYQERQASRQQVQEPSREYVAGRQAEAQEMRRNAYAQQRERQQFRAEGRPPQSRPAPEARQRPAQAQPRQGQGKGEHRDQRPEQGR